MVKALRVLDWLLVLAVGGLLLGIVVMLIRGELV